MNVSCVLFFEHLLSLYLVLIRSKVYLWFYAELKCIALTLGIVWLIVSFYWSFERYFFYNRVVHVEGITHITLFNHLNFIFTMLISSYIHEGMLNAHRSISIGRINHTFNLLEMNVLIIFNLNLLFILQFYINYTRLLFIFCICLLINTYVFRMIFMFIFIILRLVSEINVLPFKNKCV